MAICVLRRTRFACWVNKAKITHSHCAIHNVVPLQQRVHERASMLRHMYIACRVIIISLRPSEFH